VSKYIRFDVPVTKNRFLIVFVWKRKKDYRKMTLSGGDACCYSVNYFIKHYPLIGELHFVKGLIGAGMVAHEITHAALAFARTMGKKKDEEFLAETAQVMTSNFWLAVQKNKTLNNWIYKNK
jgi:hypothetical protein